MSDLQRTPQPRAKLRSAASKAAHYREEAAKLRRLAEHCGDPKDRAGLLELADQYETLARSAAK